MKTSSIKNNHLKNVLTWLVALIVLIMLLDWTIGELFSRTYLLSDQHTTIKSFQNQYLAFTDLFLTSEFIKSNDDDPGRLSRFFSEGILVILAWGLVLIGLRWIPAWQKTSGLITRFGTLLILLALYIHASFFPAIKTEFDSKKKEIIITQNHYYFLTQRTTRIPYADVISFESNWLEVSGFSTTQRAGILQLFANTGSDKYFIGETRIDSHAPNDQQWRLRAEQKYQPLADEVIQTLQEIIAH